MKKYVSEIIATFFLVFIGTGSVIINQIYDGKITLAGISVITGIVVVLMILLFGSSSGAHMNPAVTIALATKGDVPKIDIFPYIIAQAIGAFAGSFLLHLEADMQLAGGPSVLFDAVYIALSKAGAATLSKEAAAVGWVQNAFAHLKVIGASAGSEALLDKAGVIADAGVLVGAKSSAFLDTAAKGRIFDREPFVRAVY